MSLEVVYLSLGAGLLLILLFFFKWRLGRKLSIKLPGPGGGLPLLGHAFQLDRQRPWETLAAWTRQYGDAYVIKLFSDVVVVLGGPETIREALVERGRDFAGRPRPFFRAGFMSDRHQDVVGGSPDSPAWTPLRRAVQRAMRAADPPGARRTEQLTASIVKELVEEFAVTKGQPFDPRPSVYHAVMNMTCLMLIGDRFHRNDEELTMYKRLERLITTSMAVGGQGAELDVFPWLRHFGNVTYRKLTEAKLIRDELYRRVREKIDQLVEAGNTGREIDPPRYGMAQALFEILDLREMGKKLSKLGHRSSSVKAAEVLNENHLKLAIVNLLVGGAAATTGYLYVMLNILAHYPDAQERIRDEVDRIVSEKQTGSDRKWTTTDEIGFSLDDRSSMPYTSAAILELLRYGSLSPILIPHRTMSQTSINGVPLPADVTVFLHIRAVHHDREFWGNPYHYQPERFLLEVEPSDVTAPTKWRLISADDERRRRVMSFGGGPRACPGESVALTRLFLTVCSVIRHFVIKPEAATTNMADMHDDTVRQMMTSWSSEGHQTPCDPRTYDPGLVLNPKDFRVRFVPR